jgi:large subunit ribosomal protein L30
MATTKKTADGKKIKITLIKGINGSLDKHKKTIRALGLKKIGQTVEHNDNQAIRGMIFVVQHLICIS